MKTIAIIGGHGGLGIKLLPLLSKSYKVIVPTSGEVDVTNLSSVKTFFNTNDIDIVINMSGKKYDAFLSKITDDDNVEIQKMINVNINGNINILQSCLPHMIKKGWGRIIAISSVFAELNVPKNSIYCASKSFLDRLISVCNKENVKFGITCNTIQLGYWDGGMCYRVEQKYQDLAKQKIGLQRWGSAEELYNAVDFMIKTEYVCGTNLRIDGGL